MINQWCGWLGRNPVAYSVKFCYPITCFTLNRIGTSDEGRIGDGRFSLGTINGGRLQTWVGEDPVSRIFFIPFVDVSQEQYPLV